ncbi:MAG: hypothetical protein IT177_09940 [Acidobacteria bacterium]|nr:hypothetical protein [Acidobacteriota bacterium]
MRGVTGLVFLALTASVAAQTPQPFPTPRSSQPAPAAPAAPQTPPAQPAPQRAAPAPAPAAAPRATTPTSPGAPDLGGVPLYPSAVYLTSYDAGRGQRFHLYGVMLSYADTVSYYRSALKTRGDELFESPPTHQFELGRFRDSEMAFPPSVTVKDYTWGGSAGYVNPALGGTPERFPTVIQIVLAPPVQ